MNYDAERAVVTLTLTELCSLATVHGDLDLRNKRNNRSVLTSRKPRSSVCQTFFLKKGICRLDVPFSHSVRFRGMIWEVTGTFDGIASGASACLVHTESVAGRAFALPPSPYLSACLKCMAYILGCEKNAETVDTYLLLCRTGDETVREIQTRYPIEELRSFFFFLLERIEFRARFVQERILTRLPSAQSGRFPYSEVRSGQDIMMKEVYRDIRAGKRAFIEAPTGTGKTLSALYPAVRAVGDGICDKIFYLTAKAAPRAEAYRASKQIYQAGAHLRTVVFTAREQLCCNPAAKNAPNGVSEFCDPYHCPFAKGFFDRCDQALQYALSSHNGYPRSTVTEIAQQYRICPYEFQLELSEFCDILICDYNYVFDPAVYLRRYFGADATAENRYVFLIDEAHNLADRACAMYSAELCNTVFTEMRDALGPPEEGEENPCHAALDKLAISMYRLRNLCKDTLQKDENGIERGYYLTKRAMEPFHLLVIETRSVFERNLRHIPFVAESEAAHKFLSALKRFSAVSEFYDDCFVTFVETEGNICTVRLLCLDPSRILNACLSRAKASILFSATLTPLDYFSDILGGEKNSARISLPSPFPQEHLCLVTVPSVSTRLEDRSRSYSKIAALIAAAVSGRSGNYLVYFPSYRYLEKVREAFSAKYPSVRVISQMPSMHLSEKEDFLNAFSADGKLRIGFCVMGGSFSEGIDLPGNRLIGVVIIGSGLPGISNERNILKEYYDMTRERGFDYAYVYPGMNRVLQAAGRVIRRKEDRGVAILVDDRFASPAVQALFPEHWSQMQYAGNAKELANIVSFFWSNQKTEK